MACSDYNVIFRLALELHTVHCYVLANHPGKCAMGQEWRNFNTFAPGPSVARTRFTLTLLLATEAAVVRAVRHHQSVCTTNDSSR